MKLEKWGGTKFQQFLANSRKNGRVCGGGGGGGEELWETMTSRTSVEHFLPEELIW